ncbi:MAG TPA: hypothetical protein VIN40_00835 [Candidatus Tyrphobacter sp.]
MTFPKYAANGGLASGFMSVRFTVAAPFAFSTYDYIIVFNTTGNGLTPLPNGGAQANYAAFSDAIIVSGNAGGAVQAVPVQFVTTGGTNLPPVVYPLIGIPGQDLMFNANSNGLQTQFQVSFLRKIFSLYTATASPSPTPTPTSTASPTPTPSAQSVWKINCFVTSPGTSGQSFSNYTPVDSLGLGGGTDTSFNSPLLATTTQFDTTVNAAAQNAPTQSAVITSCEFQNTP